MELSEEKITETVNSINKFISKVYEAPEGPFLLFQRTDTYELVPAKIEPLIKSLEPTFSEKLMEIIRERKLDEVEVYKKADIDRRVFSKIRSFSDYRPTKDTAILLCMSMKLTLEETQDLLGRASLALSHCNKQDIIAEYFFVNEIYDVMLYKEVLYKFGII